MKSTVLGSIWPHTPNGCTISKRAIFWLWPFGLGAWLWGTVFIDKNKSGEAQTGLNQAGAHIKTKKARIVMFPEGTRHRGDELIPFKKGAFHIAIAANCPIQPIVINNYRFLDHRTHKFECGKLLSMYSL
jgi:lysophosphatidate acyltransferase